MRRRKVSAAFHKSNFFSGARHFFLDILPGPGLIQIELPPPDVKHLIALIHGLWRPSPQGINSYNKLMEEQYKSEWRFIRSASELREAGIMFEEYKKVKDRGSSLFDISFDNGKMKIPILSLYHDTERFFRNLMAYEQSIINGPTYVTDYIIFLDSLINLGRDVKILCCRGIINHWLGDDEIVAQMFNRLRDFIIKSDDDFYYVETFNNVNMHCSRRRNVWKARFWDDYCNTPWALISLLAAGALLLLALAQTIFAVMAYIKES